MAGWLVELKALEPTPDPLTAASRDYLLTADRNSRFGNKAVVIIVPRVLSDGDGRDLSDTDFRVGQAHVYAFLLTSCTRDYALTAGEPEFTLTAKSRDYLLTADDIS